MSIFNKFKNIFNKKEKKEETLKYEQGLEKTRDNFINKINVLGIKYTKISDEFFDELEGILIMADIGAKNTIEVIDKLKKRVNEEKINDFNYLKEVIVDELLMIYVNEDILTSKINYNSDDLTVIMFVGVNGVGKTTSIAKLGKRMINEGKKVMFIAADTFRAGATEQLETWAKKIGAGFFTNNSADPSSVIYDGLTKAKEENYDVCLIDTAGRLQNKDNLMKELEKMNRVIAKIVPSGTSETLLVIDATTGQNGISQAESFKSICNITGIVLTKLDGTAKGGIVLAIKDRVGIPVKFVGLGEKEDDMMPFDIENYIYGLFGEWFNE